MDTFDLFDKSVPITGRLGAIAEFILKFLNAGAKMIVTCW